MKNPFFKYAPVLLLTFTFLCNVYAETENYEDSMRSEEEVQLVESDEINATASDTIEPIDSVVTEDADETIVYQFNIHDEIDPAATRITLNAIEKAEEMNADYLLLDLNTYGGLVSDADEIRSALLDTDIPTMVFIRNNAASAGALISIACDSIYMKTGSTIGAAAVVYEDGSYAPEKYQSYMRQKMRATAEVNDRNPDIAEGMVSEKIVIPGLSDSTQIITMTREEAITHGYCNGAAESVEELLASAKITNYELVEHEVSWAEQIIALMVKPAVSGILLMILIGGIYFELKTPGIGFPLLAAGIAAILYFSPLYLEGLAANWEIALFVVGLILIIAELFFIPGFGVAGVLGIVSVIVSLSLAMVKNIDGFDFGFVSQDSLTFSFLMVSSIIIGGLMILLFGSAQIANSNTVKRLALNRNLERGTQNTQISTELDSVLIGKTAIVVSELRPSGKIEIDDIIHDAQSDGEFIDKGEEVIIEKSVGTYILVRRA